MKRRHYLGLIAALVAVTGCGSTEPAAPFTVTFTNHLDLPVTISVAGTNYATINGTAAGAGITQDVVLPGGTTSATWTPANYTYSDGTELADDLTGGTVLVANMAKIGITNTVNGKIYVDVWMINQLTVPVDVAIASTTGVRCLGNEPPGGTNGWGYYEMGPSVEVRYYAFGSHCTGSYRYWTSDQAINSSFTAGFAFFYATVAP